MKKNLEIDLHQADWLVDKVLCSDTYAQNLYAALCNNTFVYEGLNISDISLPDEWSCSWRHAGGIIADIRSKKYNECYLDWYLTGCSVIEGYLPESVISDEIKNDLAALAWKLKIAS